MDRSAAVWLEKEEKNLSVKYPMVPETETGAVK